FLRRPQHPGHRHRGHIRQSRHIRHRRNWLATATPRCHRCASVSFAHGKSAHQENPPIKRCAETKLSPSMFAITCPKATGLFNMSETYTCECRNGPFEPGTKKRDRASLHPPVQCICHLYRYETL